MNNDKLKLQVLIASTRPGRVGGKIGSWAFEAAKKHGKFDVELVDLVEVNLPIFDEPKHPRLRQYEHEHTKRWSAIVERADAYLFVTPEYNFGPTPALLNALNYLYVEWNYKPAAFVSYGGASGGMRSVQITKQTLGALKMAPIVEAVSLHFVQQQINDKGEFTAKPEQEKAANGMLDELLKWATAMKTMRVKG